MANALPPSMSFRPEPELREWIQAQAERRGLCTAYAIVEIIEYARHALEPKEVLRRAEENAAHLGLRSVNKRSRWAINT